MPARRTTHAGAVLCSIVRSSSLICAFFVLDIFSVCTSTIHIYLHNGECISLGFPLIENMEVTPTLGTVYLSWSCSAPCLAITDSMRTIELSHAI